MRGNVLRLCLLVATVAGLGEGREVKDELRFHVEPDARLIRSVRVTNDLTLASVSMTIDGQEVEDLGSDAGLRVHLEYSYVVHDLCEAVAAGQPRRVRRSFEELSGSQRQESPDDPEQSHEGDLESKLAGSEVLFTWDEEKQEFVAAFAEGETGEEYLLRGLEEDMDLRVFLPDSEVAVDASWTVELDQMMSLVMPGGDLSLMPENAPDDDSMDKFKEIFGNFGEQFGELLEGECKCTFKGARDENGALPAEGSAGYQSMQRELENARDDRLSKDEIAIFLTREWLRDDGAMLRREIDQAHAFVARYVLLDLNRTVAPSLVGQDELLETMPDDRTVRRIGAGTEAGSYISSAGNVSSFSTYGNAIGVARTHRERMDAIRSSARRESR